MNANQKAALELAQKKADKIVVYCKSRWALGEHDLPVILKMAADCYDAIQAIKDDPDYRG